MKFLKAMWESGFTAGFITMPFLWRVKKGNKKMIGNNNDDYDEYLFDDTVEVSLSCEDDEDFLKDQEQEKKSVLQKMIEYKDESTLLGSLYEISGVFGFTVVLLLGFILTLPFLLVISVVSFFITMKEKRGSKNGV